jgi:hypothetical protein
MQATAAATLTLILCLGSPPVRGGTPATAPPAQPKVEVAFVVDTTGSMQSLIDGAKQKIWYIANQIVLGKPKPVVRMALVPYRDKGDQYVTQVFDLTDNIDKVYENLMAFKADGGGDTPEHVNKALSDAINKISWSKDKNTLKIIYLVGDSPPHNEYTDTPTYDKLAKAAIEKGIYVNTILCGSNTETQKVWQEIALAAEGKFTAIEQGGGVRTVATPYDAELAKKNSELVKTVVVYGSRERQEASRVMNESAGKMDVKGTPGATTAAAADRALYAANSGRAGTGDLLDELQSKKIALKDIKQEELPPEMQKMAPKEQEAYVQKQMQRRADLNKEVQKLAVARETFIKKELEKATTRPSGFDSSVVDSLKEQGAKKNISYK